MSQDAIVEMFRKFDKTAQGVMDKSKLCKVLQQLDTRIEWTTEQLETLLASSGSASDSAVRYEEFIRWVHTQETGEAVAANQMCQAAFLGELEKLKAFVEANGKEKLAAEHGFVVEAGSVAGMSVIERGHCQLRSLSEAPTLKPATPLHYAAFAGRSEVVKYIMEDCGMSKTDEGAFEVSPSDVFLSHRLLIDGSHVEDDGACAALLGEEEEPLCAATLDRTVSRRG
eukprot:TRINITY_DN5785_c0_g1_i1.p1 TRINITY_DN5785_c0_g1~~TRINITY_DN5785_c0_g1_i1.p1  ORF type:complete len:227 (+),score=48.55 TRINITY_DN5785_c0_g1_i1:115-795(+)